MDKKLPKVGQSAREASQQVREDLKTYGIISHETFGTARKTMVGKVSPGETLGDPLMCNNSRK
jgi:hypothetical protein